MKKLVIFFLIAFGVTASAGMLLKASASRAASGPKPSAPAHKSRPLAVPPKQTAQTAEGKSAVLLPDGDVLLTGGDRQGAPIADALLVNRQTGVAAPLTSKLSRPRAGHSSTVLPDGNVLIAGGVGADGQPSNTVEFYDPATRTFESLCGNMNAARAYHTATLLTDGSVLLVGGVAGAGHAHDAAELLDVHAMNFTALH